VDYDPSHQVAILAVLAGIGQALDRASSRNLGDALSLPVILIICAVAGPIGGFISLYVGGALLRWTGSWLGGQAYSEEVRAALAWSSVPTVFSQALWIPELILVGKEMFTSATPRTDANPLLAVFLLGVVGVQIVLGIWALVILLKCLGEVHRFSAWRALVALLAGGLILFVPIFLILVLLSGLAVSP